MSYDNQAYTQSLYIHWPFCPYKCHFCPFVALAGQDVHMENYHKALIAELKRFASTQKNKAPLKTIYIGGGTPSTWPDTLLLDMLGTLRNTFDMQKISEITIEANPGTVRSEQILLWQKIGITRVSVGVQSLNDQVLQNLNRQQNATQVRNLIAQLNNQVHSVSIDIIIGLPGVDEKEWKEFIAEIVTWPIQHISMYFLSVHEGTPLYFRVNRQNLILPPEEPIIDLYYWSVEALKQGGFDQYEVSSFAKKGYESQHNRMYWERKPFKGIGIGAWSFDGMNRIQNEKNIVKYMELQQKGLDAISCQERISEESARLERIMLGLRQIKGVLISEAVQGLSLEKQELFFRRVEALEEKKIVKRGEDRVALMPTSLALENEVAAHLSV